MPDRRLALVGASLIAWASCGHASGAGGTAPPPAPDWSLPDVRTAQVYTVDGAPVIVALENGGGLSLVDPATGRARVRGEPPRGVRWEEGIALAGAVLVVESQGTNRLGKALDIATGLTRWTSPLQEFQHLETGLDGTGVGRMEWGGGCVADVIDEASGAVLAKGIPGRQVRVNPSDGGHLNEHWFVCGPAITILGAEHGDTFAMFHAQDPGLYVVSARGARRLAAAGDEVLAAGRAGDVAWARTYSGLFVAGMDLAAASVRWQRTFAEETCEYEEALEETACQARLVSVPGRAPFLLVTTGVTTTALDPSDGHVLWTHRGRRSALAVIVGEPRADAKGSNQRAFGTRLGTRWLDPDGRVLGEVPPPEPRPYDGRQLPVGDDAVLVQSDRQVTLVGRDGKPRWSVSPAPNEFYVDDVADGCALVRVEDFSTRHLRFIDLRDGRLVTEIRDVQPVLAVVRTPGRPTRIVLQRMKGGLMSMPAPCMRATR